MSSQAVFIKQVVEAFYQKARQDILIGYHFLKIQDFDSHLPRIIAFWELQLLGSSPYHFSPPLDILNAHGPLRIHRGEVNRWVMLFSKTLEEEEIPPELREKWLEKVKHFQLVFLASARLFSPD